MKSTIIIILTFSLISCKLNKQSQNTISDKNIVDYSQNNDYNERIINFKKFEEDLKSKTIYLIDNKLADYKSFRNLLDEGNVKNVKVLNDSLSIVKMDFSYEKVKKIIIVTKK